MSKFLQIMPSIQAVCEIARKRIINYPWFGELSVEVIQDVETIVLKMTDNTAMPLGWIKKLCEPYDVVFHRLNFQEYIELGKHDHIIIRKSDSGSNNYLFVGSHDWEWYIVDDNNIRKTYRPMALFYSTEISFFPNPKPLKSGKYVWWPHIRIPVVNTNSCIYKKLKYSHSN